MYIYRMGQLFIEGITTELETTIYSVVQPNSSAIINFLRFNCSVASVVTISNSKDSVEYNLYTLTLDEGDTVTDNYTYYLNLGDEFKLKADAIGITYTINVNQG